MLTKALKYLENGIYHTWLITLFSLLCFMAFENAMKHRELDYSKFLHQRAELLQEKEKALELQIDLLLQVNSQSDPAWVELKLMEKLGLVPEGHRKVFFERHSPIQR